MIQTDLLSKASKGNPSESRNRGYKGKREKIGKISHDIVRTEYKNCFTAWKEIKRRLVEDEEEFVDKLREEWKKQE